VTPKRYGVEFHNGTQIVSLFGTDDGDWTFLVRAKRQEIEIRTTPAGYLRVGKVRKVGPITADGPVGKFSE
jgi:hypothetical protein